MAAWPYDLHKATVEFSVTEHEDTLRRPKVAIKQTLTITWDDERKQWHAVGHMEVFNSDRQDYDDYPADKGGHTWHGYGDTRTGAILDWVADRCALKDVAGL